MGGGRGDVEERGNDEREREGEREMWVSDPDCQERNKSNVASTRCADERS